MADELIANYTMANFTQFGRTSVQVIQTILISGSKYFVFRDKFWFRDKIISTTKPERTFIRSSIESVSFFKSEVEKKCD